MASFGGRVKFFTRKGEDFSSLGVAKMDVSDDDDGDGSFASHFYKAGSEWSCLVSETEQICPETKKAKKMRQADLFQIWGLQKPSPPPPPPPPQTTMMKKTIALGKRLREVTNTHDPPRDCPFYKKLPGTPFTVDAFRYGRIPGCSAYFLTHFHYDHYGGLTKAWSHGPIYCSSLTARLLTLSLSLNPSYVHPLELDEECTINGIKVTLIEANHCPGAALIHFRLPDGTCYLHTGDFRASKQMQTHPLLVNQRVHVLYLDTTYCNPRYNFPSKEDVLTYVVRITKDFLRKKPKTLIVVGAYSIGKECVYLALAKALGVKIFASPSRRRILRSFGWSDLSENLCTDGTDTLLHVLPISSMRFEKLGEYLKVYRKHYAAVLAFRPTGWTYSEKIGGQLDLIRPTSRGNITIYGVPYSEHSSFIELREFVQFLKPDKIIPTVNISNAGTREKMQSYFREWLRR